MTKENAIQELIDFKGAYTEYISNDALDMAIKALEQEPCDAISKAEAIKAITKAELHGGTFVTAKMNVGDLPLVQPKYKADEWCHDCKEYDQDKHCCPRYNGVIRKAVDEIPKIRTGHWIKISPSGIYMCSVCEQYVATDDIDAYEYCHHCGVRIESEEP